MTVHVVYLTLKNIKSDGTVVNKNDSATTIKDVAQTETKLLVIPDTDYASSAGWPDLKTYLTREAALGFEAKIVTPNIVITYSP